MTFATHDLSLIRLIDSTGEVVDRVGPSGGLVALAGLGAELNVQATSADGVTLGGANFVCTIASGATVPITTTTLAAGETPLTRHP
jgi:hypothetical protein